MQEHIMNLKALPFEKIQTGTKTIELRLYDKKRQKIEVGDIITFIHSENSDLRISARIEALYIFDSFKELYEELPLLECGYTEQDVATAAPQDMEMYYPKELLEKYKAVGIKIAVCG